MAEDKQRPIVIRRKVVKADGHHGGAWKVAYADFVTAMMAFFLLMWLLNATTEEQRKGIADYFSPSIPVHRTSGGGDGPFAGTQVFATEELLRQGQGAEADRPSESRQARGRTGTDSQDAPREETLEGVAQALLARRGESEIADRMLSHVRLRRTDEGLVIEVAELPGVPLFQASTATPTARLHDLMRMIAEVAGLVTNPVAVDAHLESPVIARPARPGWSLTAERAIAARGLLAAYGMAPLRFARVTGAADRAPSWPDPRDLRNRRLEIVLLHQAPAP